MNIPFKTPMGIMVCNILTIFFCLHRIDTINNSGTKILIDGGSGKDLLKGGDGDDTLFGGKGNDSLWGGDGADTFIYSAGDGKDIIYGFDNSDTLTLDGIDFTSASYNKSSKAVTLKFDEGSITFKDFTATTFHINNNTYKISGTKLVKK